MQLQNLSIIISGLHEVEVEFKFLKCDIDQQFSQNWFFKFFNGQQILKFRLSKSKPGK